MIKISPSLLSADFANLKLEISDISCADMLHLDVMDGHFVPNITFGPPLIASIRKYTDMTFDVHLMISHPLKYIEAFAKAGSDIISVHLECDDDIDECISLIKKCGKKACVVINPDTEAEAVFPYLDKIDMVLIMSVYPGFGGQSFIESVLEKAEKIRKISDIDIEIDGGINEKTIKKAVNAGCNVLVAGTAVFGRENRNEAIETLKKLGE